MRSSGKLSAALAALCCAALAAPGLAAAESISGTVTGADTHAGISGVWVCAYGNPFPATRCAGADFEGRYKIDGLEASAYTVSFDAPSANYIRQRRGVAVGPGQELTGFDAELQVGGRISGRVIDVETGAPIEHVEVCAPSVDSDEPRGVYCGRTGADGTYLIQALETGLYRIEFGTRPPGANQVNYIAQHFPGKSRWWEAEARSLLAGTTLSGIDAAMQRGVEIAGTVTDAAGVPVVWESRICAHDAGSEAIAQCTFPEQEGRYRIAGLPFGSYKVSFGVDVEEEPGLVLHPDDFVPQYYDGKPTFAAADVLASPGPWVFAGIDATLARGEDPVKPRARLVPLTVPTWTPPVVRKPPLRCKKGFQKRRVKGKPRCLKVHKRKHHRKRGAAGAKRR